MLYMWLLEFSPYVWVLQFCYNVPAYDFFLIDLTTWGTFSIGGFVAFFIASYFSAKYFFKGCLSAMSLDGFWSFYANSVFPVSYLIFLCLFTSVSWILKDSLSSFS